MIKRKSENAVSATATAEKKAEGNEVWVYSQLLKKPFETLDALNAAEGEYRKAHEEELRKANERKAEAKAIDDAIKARDEMRAKAIDEKSKAYKAYLELCDEKDREIAAAEDGIQEKLREFCKKNPGGYHSTIKYDDGSTREYSYNYSTRAADSTLPLVSLFDKLWLL